MQLRHSKLKDGVNDSVDACDVDEQTMSRVRRRTSTKPAQSRLTVRSSFQSGLER